MHARPDLQARPALAGLAPHEAAAGLRHLPGLVFFDSAREPGAISLIAARPSLVLEGNIWNDAQWGALAAELQARATAAAPDDALPRGIAAGHVGYDGTFRFGFYDETLLYDHRAGRWHEHGALSAELAPPTPPENFRGPEFRAEMEAPDFCARVRRAQEYIAAGDIYQVNLAHRFSARWNGDAFALYERLRFASPAPQAAFIDAGETTILSASPELFLRMSGRLIRTRPIKGTRPRFRDPHADEKSAYDLITSPKEIAELIMITDLERNDLGQVCEWGSVTVRELIALERFEQVFHLVSTVEGMLRPEISQAAAFRACFPGGSITGAPKKRAREIIAELEPMPRGVYTGAIGWFGFNGESQFNIAIRTMVLEHGQAHFHAGAGIVADSIPEREWDETLAKASGLLATGY
jgi:aminodeoxychorismate synthase component I